MKKIKQLHLSFNLPIYHRQIPKWRGAIIEWAGLENHLFHNHRTGRDHYYRYPLIQYHVQNGQAAILAINEGADQLEQLLAEKEWEINWLHKPLILQADIAKLEWPTIALTDKPHRYQLQHWLPLNQDNYRWWQQDAVDLKTRIEKLESILLSHLLTFATGIRWQVPGQIKVSIQNIRRTKQLRFHGTPMMAFDISFDTNLILPANIRLGRAVSHGFGELKLMNEHHKYSKNRQEKEPKEAILKH